MNIILNRPPPAPPKAPSGPKPRQIIDNGKVPEATKNIRKKGNSNVR